MYKSLALSRYFCLVSYHVFMFLVHLGVFGGSTTGGICLAPDESQKYIMMNSESPDNFM